MNWILFLCCSVAFINPFMASSVNVAIIEIEKSLHTTSILTSWVITSYILSTAAILPIGAKLADIYGKRKIFIIGILLFAIASLIGGISENFTIFILSRITQGIVGALFLSTQSAILIDVFPKKKRGKVLGINTAFVYTGLSTGPFLGGIIISKYGWNAIFFITASVCFIVAIVSYYKLKFDDIKTAKTLYFNEFIYYPLFITLFIYSVSNITVSYSPIILIISFLFLYVFIGIQKKSEEPVIKINLFKENLIFGFSSLSALINYSATTALTFFLNLYIQSILKYDPQKSGKILLIQPVIMALISPFAGKLSDIKEPQIIASIGMLLTTVSLFITSFINLNSNINMIIIILVIAGIGFGLFSSPNTNAIMSSVERKNYAMASSIVATMRVLGQALSMAISSIILSLYMKDIKLSENPYMLVKTIKYSFYIFSSISFLGIFFSLMRGKMHKK